MFQQVLSKFQYYFLDFSKNSLAQYIDFELVDSICILFQVSIFISSPHTILKILVAL